RRTGGYRRRVRRRARARTASRSRRGRGWRSASPHGRTAGWVTPPARIEVPPVTSPPGGRMADSKVWFITGCSKGFGRVWAEAALERGDKVAATARDASTLAPLAEKYGDSVLTMALDVQDTDADFAAVKAAQEKFGRLDVVVNNAGYGLFGAVEELSEAQARDQIETNLFGALWVTQAALPIMREQGSGHIIQVSSIGGVTAFPEVSLYHASKWGLEAFSQSLSLEVADFGIDVTLVEPAGYDTDWSGPSGVRAEHLS